MKTKLTYKESVDNLNQAFNKLFNLKDNEEFQKSINNIECSFNKIKESISKEDLDKMNEMFKQAHLRLDRLSKWP